MNRNLIPLLVIPAVALAVAGNDLFKHIEYVLNLVPILVEKLLGNARELAGLVIALPSFTFWFLFVFRYFRLIVHFFSFWLLYKPTPIPDQPTILPKDVSVILPTIDPENVDFKECIESCLSNSPGEIIIVTVGRNMAALTWRIVARYRAAFPSTTIQVHWTDIANKRRQVAHGVGFATGKVTVLLDDHVFWRTSNFLATILAPFEDDKVGAVGTNKRVRKTEPGINVRSFWNMIGALYLERHNFEIRATNAIDGGVFVISGRTAAYRTDILTSPGFMDGFINERFFFGMFGPLNADDDNYLTRQVVARGYDIKIQYNQDAMIETTLGAYPRFLSQCLRWVRTTWRSNSASLFTDRTVWRRQPWCVYAVYLTSFVNFALFYDAALIYTLSKIAGRTEIYALIGWIFVTKMVKLTSYFIREPQDLIMLPGYFAFAYYHSLIKLYAGLTFWVTAWGGRNLAAINQNTGGDDDNDSDGSDGHSVSDRTPRPSRGSIAAPRSGSTSSDSTPRQFYPAPEHPQTNAVNRGVIQTAWGPVSTFQQPIVMPVNVAETQLMTPQKPALRNSRPFCGTTIVPSVTQYPSPQDERRSTIDSQIPTPSSNSSSGSEYCPSSRASLASLFPDDGNYPSSLSSRARTLIQGPSIELLRELNATVTTSPLRAQSQQGEPRRRWSTSPPAHPRAQSLSSIRADGTIPQRSTFAPGCMPPAKLRARIEAAKQEASNVPVEETRSIEPVSAQEQEEQERTRFALSRECAALGCTQDYAKTWVRGKQCKCLHSDRDMLFKTRSCRCEVEDLFGRGPAVAGARD